MIGIEIYIAVRRICHFQCPIMRQSNYYVSEVILSTLHLVINKYLFFNHQAQTLQFFHCSQDNDCF
jgi:hypothetical protein